MMTTVFLHHEESAKRKDGSEERLTFSPNVQAASNDTSLENGQEASAISVVSKVRKVLCPMHYASIFHLHGSRIVSSPFPLLSSAIISKEQEVSPLSSILCYLTSHIICHFADYYRK